MASGEKMIANFVLGDIKCHTAFIDDLDLNFWLNARAGSLVYAYTVFSLHMGECTRGSCSLHSSRMCYYRMMCTGILALPVFGAAGAPCLGCCARRPLLTQDLHTRTRQIPCGTEGCSVHATVPASPTPFRKRKMPEYASESSRGLPSLRTTLQPCSAQRCAIARPIPEAPPVTTATWQIGQCCVDHVSASAMVSGSLRME